MTWTKKGYENKIQLNYLGDDRAAIDYPPHQNVKTDSHRGCVCVSISLSVSQIQGMPWTDGGIGSV